MKVLLGLVLFFVIISGVVTAYSQSDTIPVWIKGVAGFWAEDRITDSEFVEALKFLIESGIIQVDDPKVKQLEKENMELRQKIELIESEEIQPETTDVMPPPEKDELAYITTDRQEYGLGDTIQVKGTFERSVPSKSIDGTLVDHQSVKIIIIGSDTLYSSSSIICTNSNHEVYLKFPNVVYGKFYDFDFINDIAEKCNIDDDGGFLFDFEVTGDYFSGVHYAQISIGFGEGWDLIEHSEPFTIK